MKNLRLDQVNRAITALADTKSDKQLYSQIGESAKSITGADYAKLFLTDKTTSKKVYVSDDLIKPNFLINNKDFNKLISSDGIRYLTQADILKLQIKKFPHEIKFLIVIPLYHSTELLGYLFLYFLKEGKILDSSEKEILDLFGHTISLVLNKSKLQDESQKALEIRDRFISLASHELRTPLTSIHGYIQLLHNRMKDKDTLESRWTNELYVESIRLTTLVKELLDVNRIKQGQFDFVFSEVPMQDVIARAIERYKLTNADHPFEFQCKLTNHETRIVGDFDKLVEMVSGLLGNAVKFSKPGEKITITLKNLHGILSVEVKDRGKGISKDDLSAIMTGFYKPEYASFIEGMGVGLMLARHIVENHRGKLKIKSKENKGTTVTVSLPTLKAVN
ncbi:MAG TPA: HAMP domain-containing sensor histidine kinase [Candidatus Saccharimonadales bacterium]|nr:HAMP domain-containing sensor histidine kinase [Candidatus Saccharimonadales bacterium]